MGPDPVNIPEIGVEGKSPHLDRSGVFVSPRTDFLVLSLSPFLKGVVFSEEVRCLLSGLTPAAIEVTSDEAWSLRNKVESGNIRVLMDSSNARIQSISMGIDVPLPMACKDAAALVERIRILSDLSDPS